MMIWWILVLLLFVAQPILSSWAIRPQPDNNAADRKLSPFGHWGPLPERSMHSIPKHTCVKTGPGQSCRRARAFKPGPWSRILKLHAAKNNFFLAIRLLWDISKWHSVKNWKLSIKITRYSSKERMREVIASFSLEMVVSGYMCIPLLCSWMSILCFWL
jgi:hypothetical protein